MHTLACQGHWWVSKELVEFCHAAAQLAHQFEAFGACMDLIGLHVPPTPVTLLSMAVVSSWAIMSRKLRLPHAPRYGGEPGHCGQFFHHCGLIIIYPPLML